MARSKNSKHARETYEQMDQLPGVGDDLLSGAWVDGGLTICGWAESGNAWKEGEVCHYIVEMDDGVAVLVKVAPQIDPHIRAALDDSSWKRLAWHSATIGVLGLTEFARKLTPFDTNLGDLDENKFQVYNGRSTPYTVVELGPKWSGKTNRVLDAETVQAGRFAGRSKPLYRPKQVTLPVLAQLLRAAQGGVVNRGLKIHEDGEWTPFVLRSIRIAVEVTRAMRTHGNSRVELFASVDEALSSLRDAGVEEELIRINSSHSFGVANAHMNYISRSLMGQGPDAVYSYEHEARFWSTLNTAERRATKPIDHEYYHDVTWVTCAQSGGEEE